MMERPGQPIVPSGNKTSSSENPLYYVFDMEYLFRKRRDSLRTEVLLSRNTSSPRLTTLKKYLGLLLDHFPADEP